MSKWDEKAKNYSRYTEGDDRFEAKILQALKSLHVSFETKKILDIGCGTGVYTLRIAKVASHVDALDSSAGMLEVLKEDAKRLGIKNISTKLTSWEDFEITSEKYDIAICTMSPAVSSTSHFEKMTQCAKIKIYLGWAGKRSSNILERLVEVHNATYTHPNGAKQLSDWLDIEKKSYQVLPFDEQRMTQKEFQKALQNFKWHLEIRGITPNVDKIKKVLENFCDKDGLITENMANHMNLIVW